MKERILLNDRTESHKRHYQSLTLQNQFFWSIIIQYRLDFQRYKTETQFGLSMGRRVNIIMYDTDIFRGKKEKQMYFKRVE